MIKFELSKEIKKQFIIGLLDRINSVFAEDKPYNFVDLKSLYNIFKEETIFSPYDYHDVIFNINSDTVEIGWNGQIDGEFYSAFVMYELYNFTENMNTIWLVDQDGQEGELSI